MDSLKEYTPQAIEEQYTVFNRLAQRALINKRVAEVEETHRFRQKEARVHPNEKRLKAFPN